MRLTRKGPRPWHEDMGRTEGRSDRPWDAGRPPARVLAIRFQAVGDVAVILPACAALRERLPDARIDLLTMEPAADLARAVDLFDHVYTVPALSRRWARAVQAAGWALKARRRGYEVVIDLQRHRRSRLIRRASGCVAWAEFDRFAPRPAGERVLDTFRRAGFPDLDPSCRLQVRPALLARARDILRRHGWDGDTRLIVLNPAGLWETRNWPLANYARLARLWLAHARVRFLFLGIGAMERKAAWLCDQLNGAAINLVNRTSLAQDLAVLQHVWAVVSEDAGLMHMAWASGVPTVALLGSSPAAWVRPLGVHTRCLDSSDLPCGACMRPTCRYGDVHCLTRYTPETVFGLTLEVLASVERRLPPS